MLTVQDALSLRSPEPKPIQFRDLSVGEAFRWAGPRDCGPVWCIKLDPNPGIARGATSYAPHGAWTPIEGIDSGRIFVTLETDLVIQTARP